MADPSAIPMPMPASDRLRRALALLEPLDLPRGTKTPPLHRLLWRAGIEVPPPLLASWRFNALLMGIAFGVLSALCTAAWSVLGGRAMNTPMIGFVTVCSGAFFGVLVASLIRHEARRHQLPTWDSLA